MSSKLCTACSGGAIGVVRTVGEFSVSNAPSLVPAAIFKYKGRPYMSPVSTVVLPAEAKGGA